MTENCLSVNQSSQVLLSTSDQSYDWLKVEQFYGKHVLDLLELLFEFSFIFYLIKGLNCQYGNTGCGVFKWGI